MNPLLLAILGTLAHADGDAPTLKPLAPDVTEVSAVGPCRDAATAGMDRLNSPYGQDKTALIDAQNRCVANGQSHCDASRVIPQQIAVCLSGLTEHTGARIGAAPASLITEQPSATGLLWKVSHDRGGRGTTVTIDAMTGEQLGYSVWIAGRPVRKGGRLCRARAVHRADWSHA